MNYEKSLEEQKKLREERKKVQEIEIQKKRDAREERFQEIQKMKQLRKRHPEQFKKVLSEKIKEKSNYTKPSVGRKLGSKELDFYQKTRAVDEEAA